MTTFSRLSPLFLVALGFGCTSEVPREGTSPSSVGAASGLFSADSAVADWVDAGRVTGAVLRVTRGGEVEWEQSYGFAERFDFGVVSTRHHLMPRRLVPAFPGCLRRCQ